MSDADFMLNILKDGREYTTGEILAYSIHERGCGLTVHSRAAELRKRGHSIVTRCLGRKNGRSIYAYRLVALRERDPEPGRDGSRSRSTPYGAPPAGAEASLPPSEQSASVPAPQLSLELPGSTYRKDVAA
jgi:hypothetical protein